MRYLCVLFFVIAFAPYSTLANTGRVFNFKPIRAVADTDTIIRKPSIAAGISYGSDAMFFGRTGPIKYPFISTNIIYNTKQGFFVYASALRLLGYRTSVDEIDLGAGYYYRFSKKWNGTASYTRFIFNKEARVIESASGHDINFKNSYDFKLVKGSITMDYLFGKASDFFVTAAIAKYIEPSWSVFDDKDYLTFNPNVSVIVGTQNFVQRYGAEHTDKLLYLSSSGTPIPYNNGRFNVLNYSFRLPIAYNRPHYTLEASYRYSIPVNVEGALKNRRESFFNLTLYYVFFK